MAFGKVLQLASGPRSLKLILEKQLSEDKDIYPLQKDGYIRVSSFAKMCPREEVLCSFKKIERSETIEPGLQLIFAHGTALHWALQNILIPKVHALIGEWRCNVCGTLHGGRIEDKPLPEGMIARPKNCKCGASEFTYLEQFLKNEEFRITGHPDGFLVIPGMPGVGILEAKSTGVAYKVRSAPQIDHVIQAQCYMWLTGLKWARIVYWDKGGRGMDSIIEHHVDRDEDTIVEIKKTLHSIWDGINTGTLPSRICETATCPRAKDCPVSDMCFKLGSKISDETG